MNSTLDGLRPRLQASREALWRRQLLSGSGRGVRVGILDTGVADDVPGVGQIVKTHFAIDGRNRIGPVKKGEDEIGHGTACAWIVRSLAPEAELHSVRVIGRSPREKGEKLIAGLAFAIEQGWDVINVSLGTTGFRDELAELANRAWERGIVIVAAANNHPDRESFPAALPNVIGVDTGSFEGSLDFRFEAERKIEIEAQGVYVKAPRPDGSWFHYTGSSFACPHVTGIVARVWDRGNGVSRVREKLGVLSVGQV